MNVTTYYVNLFIHPSHHMSNGLWQLASINIIGKEKGNIRQDAKYSSSPPLPPLSSIWHIE